MILMVHGYGLNGSGSNLWTRSVVAALVEQGETVHLCCQERRPELFEFIREVIDYDEVGRPQTSLTSDSPEKGGCILHRPSLDVLPTYVRPAAGASGMKGILDMSDGEIEDYIRRNSLAISSILDTYPIDAVHVNHVVLMSEAVRRACRRTDRPFAVMPHGSAIEYVVKKSASMRELAGEVLVDADRILVLNDEMRGRISDTFPDIPDVESKMLHVPVGVDVRRFRVVRKDRRTETVGQLVSRLSTLVRGRSLEQAKGVRDIAQDDATLDDIAAVMEFTGDFPQRHPDEGLEVALGEVDWNEGPIVGYVGRVLGLKGVHAILAAFPLILAKHHDASLVIAGAGPLREWLEAFRHGLAGGHRKLVRNLIQWGGKLEGEEKPFDHLSSFFDQLAQEGREDAYFDSARKLGEPGRILTTGYMDHAELSLLFGCLDVGVFPSIVREASPLVVPEAMASGVFPMGTYFGGMAASLDHASQAIPPELHPHMRIRPEPEYMVADIARTVSALLDARPDLTEEMHGFAVEHYDWQQIASRMVQDLKDISRLTI